MNNVITQARDNNGDFRGLIIDPKWFNLFDSKNYSIEPNNEVYRHVGLNTNYDLVLTFIDKQDKRPVSYFEIINNHALYNNSTFAYDILKNLSLSDFSHPIFNEDGEIITNIRHKQQIDMAIDSIKKAKETILNQMPIDIIEIYIKQILSDLGKITGDDISEDIINEIFSKFCLGK